MKKLFTIYRTIRIDVEYDTEKLTDPNDAEAIAAQKVISDVQAHMHTIENGVQIVDIYDCGDPV